MTDLLDRQLRFAGAVPLLLVHARSLGFRPKLGEAARTDEQAIINSIGYVGRNRLAALVESEFPDLAAAIRNNGRAGGIRNSLHAMSLALDLHLIRDGVYQASTEAHRELGAYWKGLDPDHAWGGDFGDGNHYSLTYNGIR